MGPSALAEQLLHDGSLGHNHFWFYRDAMDAALNDSDWDSVERYAAALENYTSAEPLPWTTFFITKGRALAKFGRGTMVRFYQTSRFHTGWVNSRPLETHQEGLLLGVQQK